MLQFVKRSHKNRRNQVIHKEIIRAHVAAAKGKWIATHQNNRILDSILVLRTRTFGTNKIYLL